MLCRRCESRSGICRGTFIQSACKLFLLGLIPESSIVCLYYANRRRIMGDLDD